MISHWENGDSRLVNENNSNLGLVSANNVYQWLVDDQ